MPATDHIDYDRFDVLTFDCYGTLIDWEAGLLDAFRAVSRSMGSPRRRGDAGPICGVRSGCRGRPVPALPRDPRDRPARCGRRPGLRADAR